MLACCCTQDSDDEAAAAASEVPKKEWKEGDPRATGQVQSEAPQDAAVSTKEAAGHQVAKSAKAGGDAGVGNESGSGAGKTVEASEVPKKEWKEGDHLADQEKQIAHEASPSSPPLSDLTQGEAEIYDENGNLHEEPQVPPPVRRQPQDMFSACLCVVAYIHVCMRGI